MMLIHRKKNDFENTQKTVWEPYTEIVPSARLFLTTIPFPQRLSFALSFLFMGLYNDGSHGLNVLAWKVDFGFREGIFILHK